MKRLDDCITLRSGNSARLLVLIVDVESMLDFCYVKRDSERVARTDDGTQSCEMRARSQAMLWTSLRVGIFAESRT